METKNKHILIDADEQDRALIVHQLDQKERSRALIEEVYRARVSSDGKQKLEVNGTIYDIYPVTSLRNTLIFTKMGDTILLFHRCPLCTIGIYSDPKKLAQVEKPALLCIKCELKALYARPTANDTLTTSNTERTILRVNPETDIKGVRIAPGLELHQEVYIINESDHTITFADDDTSNVSEEDVIIIRPRTARIFVWDGKKRWIAKENVLPYGLFK